MLRSSMLGIGSAEVQVMEWKAFPKATLHGERLCILNWNIAKQNHKVFWQREFATIFHHYHPHLCFFQEARVAWPKPLALLNLEQVGNLASTYGWYFAPNLIYHRQSYAAGVLTTSTASAVHSAALHSQYYEPFLKTRKVALITEYPITQQTQTLLTINVHGINFVRSHKFQAQMRQIELAITHHDGPIILAGDFNTWRPKRMQMLQIAARRLRLKPVQFSPTCQNNLKRFLRSAPLDHVFYRGLKLQAETTQVLSEMTSSDHKPMLIEFSIIFED